MSAPQTLATELQQAPLQQIPLQQISPEQIQPGDVVPAVTQAALPFGLELNNLLAILAAALLVFVSGGVIYLSTVEWRDRRRRGLAATGCWRRRR